MGSDSDEKALVEDRRRRAEAYWRANVRLIAILLSIWFFVSIVCGVLLADVLNQVRIGHAPLGFWIAQQGSIYVFILLVLVYTICMDRIERIHGEDF